MLFKDIDLLDENLDYKAHQWVGVKDGRIDYIGDKAPADADAYGEAYDGAGRLLLPAFYNAHAHAPMTLLRGYRREPAAPGMARDEMAGRSKAKMTPEDNYWGTLLACAEMARYGCGELLGHVLLHRRARACGRRGRHEDERVRERAVLRGEAVRRLRHRRQDGGLHQEVPRRAGRPHPGGLQHPRRVHLQRADLPRHRRGRRRQPVCACTCTSPRPKASTRSASSATAA